MSSMAAYSQEVFVVQRYSSCLQPTFWEPTNELLPDLFVLRFVVHNSQRFKERDEVVLDCIEDIYLLQGEDRAVPIVKDGKETGDFYDDLYLNEENLKETMIRIFYREVRLYE